MPLSASKPNAGHRAWAPVIAVLLFGLAGLLTTRRAGAPRPLPLDAPPEAFSAGRAFLHLNAIAGSGRPRPSGSGENAAARKYLVAALGRAGYAAELQSRVMPARRRGTDIEVHNVLARLDGREPGLILFSAHYDSVPAGPGATDDGAGVAALLEVARVARAAAPPRHGLLFLFSDAEEDGLLGARAFQQFHPWADEVRAAVNLDAGGDGGPSLLVETGPGNRAAVEAFARALPRPAGSSFGLAFKRLTVRRPDSDFAVFKASGVPGFYFAAVEGSRRQHWPADSVENASLPTIQHHGENALAMARHLGEHGAPAASEDLVFASVLSRFVPRYPVRWAWPVTLLTAAISAAAILRLARRTPGSAQVLYGAWAWVAALAAGSMGAIACFTPLRALGLSPQWLVVAPAAASAAACFSVMRLLRPAAGLWGLWAGALAGWNLAGAATLVRLGPEFHYVFTWPALAAGLGALVPGPEWIRRWFGLLPAQITALALWLPLLIPAGRGSGPAAAAVAPSAALLFTLAAPPLIAEPGARPVRLALGWWLFLLASLLA
ncbi:MAG: M20/M25/M40 family metallo-hydrolase [Bryobacterales bacterium]|nr:M20/M25/M40 family metallo-hydrolase [Bryobacterales bacterium]